MTTPFATIGSFEKSASSPPTKVERQLVPFAALEKSAGGIQNAVDGAVRSFTEPWRQSYNNLRGGYQDMRAGNEAAAQGLGRTVLNAATRPLQTIWGGLKGAFGRAGEGLGGFVEGAWEGGKGAYQGSTDAMNAGMQQVRSGLATSAAGRNRAWGGLGQGVLATGSTGLLGPVAFGAGAYDRLKSLRPQAPAQPAAAPAPGSAPTPAPAPTPTLFQSLTSHRPPAATPAPAAAPAQQATPAAPSQQIGLSNPYLNRIMGSYNPNSSRDARKMDAIQQHANSLGRLPTAQEVYSNPNYLNAHNSMSFNTAGGAKSGSLAFAALGDSELEKQALAKWIGRGLTGAGKFLRGRAEKVVGNAAERAAKAVKAPELPRFPSPLDRRIADEGLQAAQQQARIEATRTAGRGHRVAANKLTGAGNSLQQGGAAADAVNIGGGLAAAGGAGALGYNMGHRSGVGQGFDAGADFGVQSMADAAPQDPGVLGRIADVFTGAQGGPDPAAVRASIADNRGSILNQIIRGV